MRLTLGLLLILVLSLPIAAAAAPRPPNQLVVDGNIVTDTSSSTGRTGSYSSNANFTFHLSPDDPDQINGSLVYTIFLNVTVNQTGLAACVGSANYQCTGWLPVFNGSFTAISGRPGWVEGTIGFTGDKGTGLTSNGLPNGSINTWNMTARSATNEIGVSSCEVSMDMSLPGGHDQCGNLTLAAPYVVKVTVAEALTASTGRTEFIFGHSTDDPANNTTGDFQYLVWEQFTRPGQPAPPCSRGDAFHDRFNPFGPRLCEPAQGSTTIPILFTSLENTGNGGLRFVNVSYAGTGQLYLTVDATAYDPLTHMIGDASCQTTVDASRVLSTNRCGIFLGSGLDVNLPGQGTPAFPGLDVPAFAIATGLTSENTGYLLSALIVFGFAVLGWSLAKKPGMVILGALALGFAWFLNLFPTWGIIAVFAAATTIIVLMWGKGK